MRAPTREEIESAMEEYLEQGGVIKRLPDTVDFQRARLLAELLIEELNCDAA